MGLVHVTTNTHFAEEQIKSKQRKIQIEDSLHCLEIYNVEAEFMYYTLDL